MTTPPTPRDVIEKYHLENCNRQMASVHADDLLTTLQVAGYSIVPTALVQEAVILLGAPESPVENNLAARLRACVNK